MRRTALVTTLMLLAFAIPAFADSPKEGDYGPAWVTAPTVLPAAKPAAKKVAVEPLKVAPTITDTALPWSADFWAFLERCAETTSSAETTGGAR